MESKGEDISFKFRAFLDRLMGLLNKTKARERICRFFQYFGKFIINYAKANANGQEIDDESYAKIFDNIGLACAAVRKVLRFGMEFPCIIRINNLLEKYFQSQHAKREGRRHPIM